MANTRETLSFVLPMVQILRRMLGGFRQVGMTNIDNLKELILHIRYLSMFGTPIAEQARELDKAGYIVEIRKEKEKENEDKTETDQTECTRNKDEL